MEDTITTEIRKLIRQGLEAFQAKLRLVKSPSPRQRPAVCTCSCRGATSPGMSNAYWTTAQAASFLGLSRETALNMRSKGETPFFKDGRINAYSSAELEAFRNRRSYR